MLCVNQEGMQDSLQNKWLLKRTGSRPPGRGDEGQGLIRQDLHTAKNCFKGFWSSGEVLVPLNSFEEVEPAGPSPMAIPSSSWETFKLFFPLKY